MSHRTRSLIRLPLRWVAACAMCAVLAASGYVSSAAASGDPAPGGMGHAKRQGDAVVRGATRRDATVLLDPPASDGELLIHAAYEAARRMVEMEATATTVLALPTTTHP